MYNSKVVIYLLCFMGYYCKGQVCLNDWPQVVGNTCTSSSCPFQGFSNDSRQLRLFPSLKIECDGTLTGFFVAGENGRRSNGNYPELQIWRLIEGFKSQYHKMESWEFPSGCSQQPNNVQRCTVNPTFVVEDGDIIGISLPRNHINFANFRVYFMPSLQQSYILPNVLDTLYTVPDSPSGVTDQPLITLDIDIDDSTVLTTTKLTMIPTTQPANLPAIRPTTQAPIIQPIAQVSTTHDQLTTRVSSSSTKQMIQTSSSTQPITQAPTSRTTQTPSTNPTTQMTIQVPTLLPTTRASLIKPTTQASITEQMTQTPAIIIKPSIQASSTNATTQASSTNATTQAHTILPTTQASSIQAPITEQTSQPPSIQAPITEQTSQPPSIQAPITEQTTQASSIQAPITEQTTQTPAIQSITQAPTTLQPSSTQPINQSPSTQLLPQSTTTTQPTTPASSTQPMTGATSTELTIEVSTQLNSDGNTTSGVQGQSGALAELVGPITVAGVTPVILLLIIVLMVLIVRKHRKNRYSIERERSHNNDLHIQNMIYGDVAANDGDTQPQLATNHNQNYVSPGDGSNSNGDYEEIEACQTTEGDYAILESPTHIRSLSLSPDNESGTQAYEVPVTTIARSVCCEGEWGLIVPSQEQRSNLSTTSCQDIYSYVRTSREQYGSAEPAPQFFEESEIYWAPSSIANEIYEQLAKQKYREIFRPQIRIGKFLSRGAFGTVSEGVWQSPGGGIEVAVKTNQSKEEEDKIKFLQEAAIMGQFRHPNVVQLMGVVTVGEPVMIVLELLSNGDLRNFLANMKPKPGEMVPSNTPKQLLKFCRQICCGMEYLARKAFVHRDLAARNVLVSDKKECKISDFGMSRDLMDESYYTSRGGKIPVKWTAPEALHYKKYSTASDVWSFGCVMYEIWSLGHKPFESHSNAETIRMVDKGVRLPPPPGCPREMYKLMLECWYPETGYRPSFAQLVEMHSQANFELLSWRESDTETGPQVNVVGAPLEAAKNLYSDLQNVYIH